MNAIYFNEGAINLLRPLSIIRAAQRRDEFRIVCSSSSLRRRPALERLSDRFEIEPSGLADDEYVDWCLDLARRHRIDLFFPGRRAIASAAARSRFEAIGVRVLSVADGPTLSVLSNKATAYRRLASLPVNIPDYAVAHDSESFDAALRRLQAHSVICYKPTVSVYGVGFRILASTPYLKRRLRRRDPWVVAPETARAAFAAGKRTETIVMEYLRGPERSVDCLAQNGELLRCVVRRKSPQAGRGQWIERHPQIEDTVRAITRDLSLNGMYNVQFRDAHGKPYLLEINARMSGGLRFSCQAGVALPYWALRLALNTAVPDDVPQPKVGLRVGRLEVATSH